MSAAQTLIDATIAVAAAGVPLMLRVVPADAPAETWAHYPPDDAVDPATRARWFYHAHPPGEREAGEHGHFHLFLDPAALPGSTAVAGPRCGISSGADVVHVVALSIDTNGLPTRLFTVNRWVTDEWLHPAPALIAALGRLRFEGAGDPLVDRWLSAAVDFYAPVIVRLLAERDAAIATWAVNGFEDRALEILSSAPIDINDALAG